MAHPTPRISPVVLAGLGAGLALAALQLAWFWPEVIDDSYIFFRCARNFVGGHGFAFNVGGPFVESCSSFLWFWVSAAFLALGRDDVLTAVKWTGLALHLVTLVVTWRLAGGRLRGGPALAVLAPILFACSSFAAYHAVTGLETPLYTALLAASVLAAAELEHHPRTATAALAVALALLSATRPEAFGYVGGILTAAALTHRGEARTRVLRAGLFAIAAIVLLALWRHGTFGKYLPNTVGAKSAGYSGHETFATGLEYVGRFLWPLALPVDLVLYALSAFVLFRRGGRRDVLLATPVVCAMAFSAAVRGDWMNSFRFLVPVTPMLAALIARAAVESHAAGSGAGGTGGRAARATVTVVAAATLALFGLQHLMVESVRARTDGFGRTWKPLAWTARIPGRLHAGYPARLAVVTRWSLEHLSSGQMLATADIGFPGWTLDEPILDVAGLADSALARIVPRRDTAAFAAYLRAQSPDVVLVRLEDGRPSATCDAMLIESGVLGRYSLADSLVTHSSVSRVLFYLRRDRAFLGSRDTVLAQYDRAIRFNPLVPELREWRETYAARTNPAGRP